MAHWYHRRLVRLFRIMAPLRGLARVAAATAPARRGPNEQAAARLWEIVQRLPLGTAMSAEPSEPCAVTRAAAAQALELARLLLTRAVQGSLQLAGGDRAQLRELLEEATQETFAACGPLPTAGTRRPRA